MDKFKSSLQAIVTYSKIKLSTRRSPTSPSSFEIRLHSAILYSTVILFSTDIFVSVSSLFLP
jgi:hypothetical protein